jgi:ABC-2 type transport system permease protein
MRQAMRTSWVAASLMDELRAAFAVARKDIRNISRYRFIVASQIFTPLYQGVLPGLLFGASFAVAGRVVGLEKTIGTDDLSGFIFLGGVVSGLVATAFWVMGMSFRQEQEMGTLEPTWLTPTGKGTLVVGRALGGMFWFVFSEIAIFAVGILFFGLRLRWEMVYAIPSLVLATIALVGFAHLLAAIVLTIRDANLFIDCTNFLFGIASGVAFPITLLPGVLQPFAYLLPTTYAMDILRQHALGTPPLVDPVLEYAGLILTTLVMFPIGRWAFARADHRMRVQGTVGQY